jgi:curved DNA-binding protein CbpA
MDGMMTSPYDRLGIPRSATQDEIKKAYLKRKKMN